MSEFCKNFFIQLFELCCIFFPPALYVSVFFLFDDVSASKFQHPCTVFLSCVSLLTWSSNCVACRVHLEFPKIEVRFQNLTVDAYVHVGSRALPTIPNFLCNLTEV